MHRTQKGFTLTELVIAFVLIGILAGMIVPALQGLKTTIDDKQARTNAAILNSAKTAYIREQGQAAYTSWATASDEQRFGYLKPLIGPSTNLSTLAAFPPSGYSIVLNDLNTPVTLMKGVSTVNY